MPFALAWHAEVLRAGGCVVDDSAASVGDWKNRGHGDFGTAHGVLLHDTAGRQQGDHPSLQTCIDGRPDLAGPLCNLYLSRSGVFYPIAAGKGWHAGKGNWQGITDGNGQLIGIEMENDGTDEPWSPTILKAAHTGVVAIARHIGVGPQMIAGHREYALPHGRKIDPNFDCEAFRATIASLMDAPNDHAQGSS